MTRDPADFEGFVMALPARVRSTAFVDDGLATAYWQARGAGHPQDALVHVARSAASASNPVGAVIARMRPLASSPPPVVRADQRSHLDPHQPCADGHDGCVLCTCDPKAGTVHHVPTPMPDWFRQAWHELRVARTGLMP